MSSESLRSSILAAREYRQFILEQHLQAGYPATLLFSLNIPGKDKNPPGAAALFQQTLAELRTRFPVAAILAKESDLLGPWALMGLDMEAGVVKLGCIELEEAQPSARLIDLDVYDRHGGQIDRKSLSLGPRPCLVCDQPAVDCIRLGRHTFEELTGKTDELLAHFRD